jgi:hypothetical protein
LWRKTITQFDIEKKGNLDAPGILTERYSLTPAWVEQVADATRQAVKSQ